MGEPLMMKGKGRVRELAVWIMVHKRSVHPNSSSKNSSCRIYGLAFHNSELFLCILRVNKGELSQSVLGRKRLAER